MTDEFDKQKLLRFIESRRDDLVRFLQELVAIPSDNPPGDCGVIAEHVHQRLQAYDFKQVSMHEISPEELAKIGMTKVSNVVAYEVFDVEQGPEITLNSHGDVVPPGAGWTKGPYGGEIIDGKLYGRGAAVSKSDIVTFTFAVLALREVATSLEGKVSLAFTFDEETGGEMGPKWLLEKDLIKPDYAVCPGFSYSIVNAHNGCLHMEVTIKGKQAHAAEPQHGHDALESMTEVLAVLYQYRKTLAAKKSNVPGITSPTLVVGKISGGINTNVVPDECKIRLDRRLIPEDNPEEVEKELISIITKAAAKVDGIEIETKRILLAKSFGPISE
ncbi:MAG: acetylornithine deacetylase, partial [Bacillus sp. (in: firmicutes)]|nr:acetylornithine deacetylase [Bacillus sp. (in: firmicutes)]